MRTVLWFGLTAGALTVLGGVLGVRPLVAVGGLGLLLALASLPFTDRASRW